MKRPRSPYAPRRSQYVAAVAIAVAGLVIAAAIAVAAVLATGNIPTAPSSYKIQLVHVADTAPGFAPHVDAGRPTPPAAASTSSLTPSPGRSPSPARGPR